jgi:HlyD family secretion protein
VTQPAPSPLVIAVPQAFETQQTSNQSTTSTPETLTGRRRLSLFIRVLVAFSSLGLVGAGWWGAQSGRWRSENPIWHLPMTTVAKADLSTVVTTWGRVESSHNTIISCEIERLEMSNAGKVVTSGGASTILELVEEGKEVKAGDVLCLLDGSDYEELIRTQEIKTLQADAALRQAQLNFEVAEISVREYQEGLYRQNLQSMEGLIFLARSDLERAEDRLRWSEKMLEKGYLPIAKKTEAEQIRNQSDFDLQTYRFDLNNYLVFGSTRTKLELYAEVEKRRFEVTANTQRVTRNRERLAHYKQMLEFCTIRAPHDGFVIYAVDQNRPSALPIEPGQTVRQAQKLFFLPDLSKMQVMAYLHESVASRVHEGMRAKAKIEGLSNRTLEGHVVSVAPLPTTAGNFISDEVKYFVSVVQLDSVPIGMRPGMSAEVEFDVDRCQDVLAVSSEAIAVEQGHNICYVAGVDGLERRPVTLGRSNRDLLEVTKGLAEGEQVVLRPEKIDAIDSMVVHSDKDSLVEETGSSDRPSGDPSPISVD